MQGKWALQAIGISFEADIDLSIIYITSIDYVISEILASELSALIFCNGDNSMATLVRSYDFPTI